MHQVNKKLYTKKLALVEKFYEKGNYCQSVRLLKTLVGLNNPKVYELLSDVYSFRLNNRKLARYWIFLYFKALSKKNQINDKAFYYHKLGTSYQYGEFRNKNTKKALENYIISAEYGSVESQAALAFLYRCDYKGLPYNYHDLDKSLFYLLSAAKNNHAESCFEYGVMLHDNGKIQEGLNWIKKSATLEFFIAQRFLKNRNLSWT